MERLCGVHYRGVFDFSAQLDVVRVALFVQHACEPVETAVYLCREGDVVRGVLCDSTAMGG